MHARLRPSYEGQLHSQQFCIVVARFPIRRNSSWPPQTRRNSGSMRTLRGQPTPTRERRNVALEIPPDIFAAVEQTNSVKFPALWDRRFRQGSTFRTCTHTSLPVAYMRARRHSQNSGQRPNYTNVLPSCLARHFQITPTTPPSRRPAIRPRP